MGRLADLFDNYKGGVEESVKHVLGRADDTLEALRNRVEELEAKLRDVAGEAPTSQHKDQATREDLDSKSDGVVTSSQTNNPPNTSVAAEADQSARKNTRSKK